MPGGMAEQILEVQTVRLAVAGKIWAQPFSKQHAAHFEHQFKLLYAGCPKNIEQHIVMTFMGFSFLECPFK